MRCCPSAEFCAWETSCSRCRGARSGWTRTRSASSWTWTRQNWRRLLVLTKANGPIWPIPPGDRRCSGTTAPLHIGKSESENAARGGGLSPCQRRKLPYRCEKPNLHTETSTPISVRRSSTNSTSRSRDDAWPRRTIMVRRADRKPTLQVRKAKSPYGDINPDQRPALLDEFHQPIQG